MILIDLVVCHGLPILYRKSWRSSSLRMFRKVLSLVSSMSSFHINQGPWLAAVGQL